ncbi:MAG TPA: amine dehydrogenase large subunit, partial [Azospira sp.]|nr:amine dehydrogenase large subunit [Azospira sp.]
KHAQALPYKGTIATTSDGRFILVQNATPATSVSVVDRLAGKFVAEITTPGCWIIVPYKSDPRRFATLCGDGALLSVTLDESGQPVARQRSRPFFDPDEDPLFVQTVNDGDRHFFVSFKGQVHGVDLAGAEPTFLQSWSLTSAKEQKQGWRPGGYQPLGLHSPSGRLYVGVHPKGHEGSHKEPAREIWAFDLKSQKRLQRVPGNAAIALAVSRGAASPRLFAYDGLKSAIVAYDALPRLAQRGRLEAVGESPTLMELQ